MLRSYSLQHYTFAVTKGFLPICKARRATCFKTTPGASTLMKTSRTSAYSALPSLQQEDPTVAFLEYAFSKVVEFHHRKP